MGRHDFATWILSLCQHLFRLCHIRHADEVLADMAERHKDDIAYKGRPLALFWLVRQALMVLGGHLTNKLYWSGVMLKNYVQIALRNTAKQKVYTFITLSGLICGLAVFILFNLMGEHLSHYDQFHQNSQRIYSLVQVMPGGMDGEKHTAMTPGPLLPALQAEIPEIENGARFLPAGQVIVKHQDKTFYENALRFVDPAFFSIFSFGLKSGDRAKVLDSPHSVVLTEAMARKYFGTDNPMGQTLTLNNTVDVTVTGVAEDVPESSTLYFSFLVSMETARSLMGNQEDWNQRNQAAFILLNEGVRPEALEAKLSTFLGKHYAPSPEAPKRLYLFPLRQFFLDSEHIENCWKNGNISFVAMWVLSLLALLIACINYMNLSTARFVKRANEVGMRKVIGATRRQLLFQFLGESIFMALIALPLAILLFIAIKPLFIQYVDPQFDGRLWDYPVVLIKALITTLVTGVVSGLYPAVYLSSFTPIRVLQGKLGKSKKGGHFRKALVVVQFFFSVVIIVLTLSSMRQARFNQSVDLGFDRRNILAVMLSGETREKLPLLQKEIIRHNNVVSVTAASGVPVGWDPQKEVVPQGFDDQDPMKMNVYGVDYGFIEMLQIDMMAGTGFSRDHSDKNGVVINEIAARQLGWEDPLGKTLSIDGGEYVVSGMVKDYHFRSVAFERTLPAVFRLEPEQYHVLLVKYLRSEGRDELLSQIKTQWTRLAPDQPFEYRDLNQYFLDVNINNDKTSQMTAGLGFVAILLSCLGLFGLTAFSVERRVKEIGIRKVLGATEASVVFMLSKEFLILVAISNLIALPLSYLMMNRILQLIYVYPAKLGVGIFLFTAAMTLLIAFATVASLAIRAARINSSTALKYE